MFTDAFTVFVYFPGKAPPVRCSLLTISKTHGHARPSRSRYRCRFSALENSKVREQLNKCLIKAGYPPCHLLYDRTTVITNTKKKGVEEFYLDYGTEHQLFLFRAALLFDEDDMPFLLFNCFDDREALYHFRGC